MNTRITSRAALAVLAILTLITLSTCEDLLTAGLGEDVDIAPPTLDILSPENGHYVSGETGIELTFSDDAEVSSLVVYVGEESAEPYQTIEEVPDLAQDEVWSYILDTTAFDDGEIEVRIVVSDPAGKRAEKRVLVYIDNRSPVVLVNNPTAADTEQFNDEIAVRGEAADDAGIASVTIAVFDAAGNEVDLLDQDGEPTGTNLAIANGTNSWSFQFDSRDYTTTSESFRFVVTATDRAGAQSSHFYYDDDVRAANGGDSLTVEELYRLEKPEEISGLSLTSAALVGLSRDALELTVNQDLDSPLFEFSSPSEENRVLGEGAFAIGTIRDDDGIDADSIHIRFDSTDDADWIPVTSTSGRGISIAFEHDLSALSEGEHTVQLQAVDINGLAATSEILEFLIDSGVPVVEIDTPEAGSYLNGSFTISGTARDTVGIGSVEVRVGATGAYQPVSSFDIDSYTEVSGSLVWDWSHEITVATDGSDDGTRQYRVRVTDTSGKSTSENLQVFIDSDLPEVSFLGIADGQTVNGDLLIQGTTQNVSPIESLTLQIGSATDYYVLDDTVNELDADPTGTSDSTFFRWYKTIDTTLIPDGSLEVSMTAVDAAGNSGVTMLTLAVDQTTDVPVIIFDNVDASGAATDNAFFGSASIIGRMTDDDGIDTDTVEARIDGGAWVPVTSVSGSGLSVNWEHVLSSIDEGNHTIEIRGEDINGIDAASTTVSFLVDNGAPAVTITGIEFDGGNRSITSNFQGSYVSGPFTVSGTATDGFGVDTISVEVQGSGTFEPVTDRTSSTTGTVETVTWSYFVDTTDDPTNPGNPIPDGTVSLRVRTADFTGKTGNSDVELVLDTVDPEVSFLLPLTPSTLNGTETVSGTAGDANRIEAVFYIVTDSGNEPPAVVSTTDGWTEFTQLYSWSDQIDTRVLDDNADHTIHVVAIDAAGNMSSGDDTANAAERTFRVDQSTDRPVVSFEGVSATATDNQFVSEPTATVIEGTITDDDGVDTTAVEARNRIGVASFGPWQPASAIPGLSISGSGAQIGFAYELSDFPESPEVQTIELRGTDTDPDGAGAVTGTASAVSFYIDNSAPSLVETEVGVADQQISNVDLDFGGTALDTNALESLEISVDGGAPSSITVDTDGPDNIAGNADDGAWSYTFPSSIDGEFSLRFTATDVTGKSTSLNRSVLIDASAPADPVIAPFSGAYVVNELSASGTASDTESGLASVEYQIDGTGGGWTSVTGTSNWFRTIEIGPTGANLAEGDHTLYVRSIDRAGNASDPVSRAFVVDRANPSVTVAGYDGTVYRSALFTIDGTASDTLPLSGAGVVVVEVTADGSDVDLSSHPISISGSGTSRTWSQDIPISEGDGTYEVSITATDAVGRSTVASRTVIVDTTPPVVDTISNLADGALVQSTGYTVTGTASDTAGSGVSRVEYRLNGGSWTDATGTTSWSAPITLSEALGQTLEFRATDVAGNTSTVTASTTVNFDVDASNPVLAETVSGIPGVSTVYRTGDVSLGGEATDGNAVVSVIATYAKDGASPVEFVNESGVELDDDAWSGTLPAALGDGAYELDITATDEVGKTSSITRNIIIDTAVPDLTITAPVPGEFVEGVSYTIRGQVTDNGGKGVDTLAYSFTGAFAGEETAITLSGLNWSVTGINLSGGGEGPRTLYVRATDGLTHAPLSYNEQSVNFSYDTAPPELEETLAGSSAEVISNVDVDFEGTATDTNSLATLEVSINGGAGIPVPVDADGIDNIAGNSDDGYWTYSIDNTTDGAFVLLFTATDVAGRQTTIERNVFIDATPPDAPSIDALSGTYVVDELPASGSAEDSESGIASVEYQLDGTGGSWTTATGTTNWFKTITIGSSGADLAEGDHTLHVRAVDRATNPSNPATLPFVVDRTNPTVSVTGYDGTVFRNAQFTIGGTATDTLVLSGAGIVTVTATAEGSDVDLSGNPISITGSGTSRSWSQDIPVGDGDGSYVITITATDAVGRTSQTTRTVTVDTADPTFNVLNISGDGTTLANTSSYTVVGDATDGLSGVVSVEYSLDYSDDADDGNDTWLQATGTTNWSVPLTGLTDGLDQTFAVRATDNAGNTSAVTDLDFDVDLTPPALAVTGGNTGETLTYLATDIAIDGTGTDPNGINGIIVTYSRNGAADRQILNDTTDDGTWATGLAIDPDGANNNPGDADDVDDAEYVLTITATDTVGKSTTLTRTVRIDTVLPTTEYTSLTPVIDTDTVNGKITVRAAVADDIGLDQVEWAILPDGTPPTGGDYTAVTGSKTSPVFEIDTTVATDNVVVNGATPASVLLADEAVSRLWIRATDRAGNELETDQSLSVSQASDLPRIEFSGIDTTATDPADSYKNLIESNAVIRFVVTDDDLVDVSTIEISVDDDLSWEPINRNGGAPLSDGVNISTSHNLSLPTVIPEGTHSFYLRVSDEVSAKDGLAAEEQQVGPIYVMADRNFPIVTETTIAEANVFRSALYGLDGEISDTNALSNITVVETKDGVTDTEVLNTDLSGLSDTWSITNMPADGVTDGEFLYTITATDASDKQTVITRTVTIDTTAPELPVVTTPPADAWLNSTTFIFEGTAADGTGSGVDEVYFLETTRGGAAPAKGDPAWNEASVDGSGNWTASVSIAAAGERTFHVYSIDAAGNDAPIATHDFGLDQAGPSVAFTGGVGTQYVNGDFTISGTFTDASGVASIGVESSEDNSSFDPADPATASFDNGTGTWSFNRTIGSQTDGTYYYRFNVTDLAGNSTQITRTINLDTSAPAISFDATSPSISFDGPGQRATANGSMTLSGSITEDQTVANLATLEYRLNAEGWNALGVSDSFSIAGIDTTGYPDSTDLVVTVRAIDRNGNEGSDSFTLAVLQSSDIPQISISSPTDGATILNTSVTVIGDINDDDGVSGDPGTVEYRYYNGSSFSLWTDLGVSGSPTARSFNFIINSASDGAKLLEIRATDITGTTSATEQIGFTFDTDEPEFTGLSPANGVYFNADFTVSGTASDDTGVVDSVRYRVERDGVETTAWTYLLGPGNATASEPFSQLIDTSAGTGEYEVFLEASDGTFTRPRSIVVTVDKNLPSAAFTAPAAASTQNNIIDISGTASDDYGLQTLEWRVIDVNSGNAEMALPSGTPSGIPSSGNVWTIDGFDTRNATLVSYANDLGGGVYEITLRVLATDLASNSFTTAGGSDLVFQIDQSTDNPVVTFDEIATDGSSTVTTTVIRGNVTDDDGIASIQVDTYAVDNSVTTETVTLTSGSYGGTDLDWRVTLTDNENGLRGIRVIAVDTVNNDANSQFDTGRIDFELDTEDPDVAIAGPLANITWSANDSFDVSGTAGDETGITALAYKIDDNDFGSGTTPIGLPYDNWSFTIPQGDLADGPHTIYIQATDSVGNTRIASRQISVDKTAPTIGITSPASGAAVFGPLTIGGTAADNSGGAGVDSVSVGLGKQIDPLDLPGSTWIAVAGTTSWSFDFANINDYANTTFAYNTGDLDQDDIEDAGETWTDIWDFTFYVRAIDSAGDGGGGNTAYLTSYSIQIDPKRDRPEVTILSPDDGATVGGFVRVFGSSFDSQFVEKVQIAIDANNNGDYTDDSWSEATADETDAGVEWYLASGTTSWSINLNEASEFDPTGVDTTRTITFKVRAKDYKVTPGDGIYGAEEEYSITFNKDFPQFESMSIASGSTVGGTEILTGIVRDETDIDRIIFSNEGPLLDNTVIFDNPGGLMPPGSANLDVSSAAAQAAGITVTLIGSSDGRYDADYPGSYLIDIPIDTEAPGLYPGGAGSMSVKVTAEDTTTPSPFSNQYLVSFSVDNVDPSLLTYTGDTDIVGTSAELMGTVRDTGTVSGIDRVVVYLTNASGDIVRLQTATGSIGGFVEADVLDEENTTYDEYRMIIDNPLEDGNDTGSAGDVDGIPEYLTLSAGTYNWSGLFNSTLIPDGAVTIHYIAEDFAGNTQSDVTSAFIANNRPTIDSIVLGTDLNGDGSVTHTDPDPDELTGEITTGYGATGYTARNDMLYIGINASDGNGTLRYSVLYEGVEQNVALTQSTLTIDTSGFADSSVDNDRSFVILVYDSTTSNDADPTNELTDTITVNLTIDNVDELPPSIAVAPFGERYNDDSDDSAKALEAVADYEENIAMNLDERLGYLEYADDSSFDNGSGNDADVSGRIIFKGKAEDNQQIDRITATITNYDGGNGSGNAFDIYNASGSGELSTAEWAFTIDGTNYLTDTYGNVFNWNFAWDSATHDNIADTDVSVTFAIYDASGTANDPPAVALGFDIVPYITDVQTVFESGTLRYLKRSATGAYPIGQSDSAADLIRITGFNLDPGATDVTVGTATLTVEAEDTAGRTWVDTRKNSTVSGYLTVTTGTIDSINNTNTDLPQNEEPTDFGPDITDDRYLMFWLHDSKTTLDGKTEAVMKPNGGRTDMNWMYVENAQRVFINTTQLTNSWSIKGGDFAYNDSGRPFWIFLHDMNWYSGASAWDYYGSVQWGKDQATEAAAYNWHRSGTDRLALGNLSFNSDPNYTYSEVVMNRYRNLRIETDGTDTDTDHFVAYYDVAAESRGIVFWSFKVGSGLAAGDQVTALANGWDSNLEKFTNADDANYPANNGYDVGLRTPSTGISRVEVTSGGEDSEYFDLAWDDANANVYIAYYDEANGELKLAYNTDPVNSPGTWTTRSTAIDTGGGQYVKMAVDPNGGIHLAYFDGANSNLKYAYLPAHDTADGNVEVYTIDALFTNGMYNGITIRDFSGGAGTDYRPVISSYSLSYGGTRYALRVAYPLSSITGLANGADPSTGAYTGSWEVVSVASVTAPGQSTSFVETDAVTNYLGQIVVGYNGAYIEEATLLDETP